MRQKKQSGIYSFLDQSGLLEHGTVDEIIAAKKLYWSDIRKEWKQQHRKDYKSYTIFFSAKEQHLLEQALSKAKCSINSFIKNACLRVLNESPGVDAKTIGAIRELLVNFYSDVQLYCENPIQTALQFDSFLEKFMVLEKSILSLLKPQTTSHRDY